MVANGCAGADSTIGLGGETEWQRHEIVDPRSSTVFGETDFPTSAGCLVDTSG